MEWKSIIEEKPEEYDWVLVTGDSEIFPVTFARYTEMGWDFFFPLEGNEDVSIGPFKYDWESTIGKNDITHWMPIPRL